MVSPTSRMVSAISLGVFWRLAPSTSEIIRSRNDSPGLAVICTTMWSETTVVPPVTAERSPPLSRITGADSPVMANSLTVAMPLTTSPSPGMMSPACTSTRSPLRSDRGGDHLPGRGVDAPQLPGLGVGLGPAQTGRLGLAPPLGHRFGEVGEQHGEPQPGSDLTDQAGLRARRAQVADEDQGRQQGGDGGDEDHRVAEQHARVELAERVHRRLAKDRAVERVRV